LKLHRLNAVCLLLRPGADKFIQAYTTQTPLAPRGAFLDAKGKAVAVYDRVRLDADSSVLVIAASVRDRLKAHLKGFLFLTDTALTDLPHAVYWDLDLSPRAADARAADTVPVKAVSPSEMSGWSIPRSAGTIRIFREPAEAGVGEEDFKRFRLLNGLPLQGEDYDDPMLLNLGEEGLVSFTKGCYLGQEIMARVHYRGRPPLRLTAVRESQCPADLRDRLTSRVKDPDAGEDRGFVFLPA
jgi:folate-binding protein YgfZ